MRKLAFAALAAITLGACATTNQGNGGTASRQAAASGTQYCWQGRLTTEGGKHTCNWAADKRTACEGAGFTSVDAGRYAAPRKATMCANGQWLVELTPAG